MSLRSKMFGFAVASFFTGTAVMAQQGIGISLGVPSYGGNGCPQGSVGISLSDDESELSMNFDSYQVEAGGYTYNQRKNCNLAIPILVPSGYQVSIIRTDYRGYVSAPFRDTRVELSAEYFLPGQRGIPFRKTFSNYEDNYTLTAEVLLASQLWTTCNKASTTLRLNTGIVAISGSGNPVSGSVDSIDMNTNLVYRLAYRSCR